jgi:hypothetical protein
MIEVFVCVELAIIIILLSIYSFMSRKPKVVMDKDQYMISLKVLEDVMHNYKEIILIPKIESIKKNYDLNPESKMNSSHVYNEERDKMINAATIEIMKHMSPQVLENLANYYSREALLYIIISNLRSI